MEIYIGPLAFSYIQELPTTSILCAYRGLSDYDLLDKGKETCALNSIMMIMFTYEKIACS